MFRVSSTTVDSRKQDILITENAYFLSGVLDFIRLNCRFSFALTTK